MLNARLDEAQAGDKIARRNINNLRYADETTLMAESKELKSLLMKVKEESEKLASNSTFRKRRWWHPVLANRWGNNGNSERLYFLWLQNHADGDCSHEIKRHFLLGRKAVTNLYSILKSRDIANKDPSSQSYGFSNCHVWM